MNCQIAISSRSYPVRDAAVDGLLRGLLAGGAMLLYLMFAALTYGESPLMLLSRFGRAELTSPVLGLAAHMGMSSVYGILFVVLWRLAERSAHRYLTPIAGVAYGITLFLVAESVLLPATQSPMLQIPAIHFGIGHFIYGLVLGYLTERR